MSDSPIHEPNLKNKADKSGLFSQWKKTDFFSLFFVNINEQLDYLPQSIKLEESVNPHIIRISMGVISLMVLVFIIWAALTNINEVSTSPGTVKPRGFIQVVQHLDGGIITEILTREGDLVEKGEMLVKVDDGEAQQNLAELKTRQISLLLESERLRAIVSGEPPDFVGVKGATASQREKNSLIYNSQIQSHSNEKLVIKKQIDQRFLTKKHLESRYKAASRNLSISTQSLKLHEDLLKKGHTSKVSVMKLRQEVNTLSDDMDQISDDTLSIEKKVSELEARLLSLDSKFYNEMLNSLDRVDNEIDQNFEVLRKLDEKVKRLNIRSPVKGIIKGFNINTIGSVIDPGQTLMEIVPLDENLIIESKISPRDIGHVHTGQNVRVKLSSYEFTRYGSVDGVLEFVSASTFKDASGDHYRGRIRLLQTYVGNNENNVILPGMTVDADIITGEKSVLDYLLKPIHLSLRSAFTER